METLKFKTNINCSGCVAKVTPKLNETKGIENWKVDLESPDRILIVNTEDASSHEIIEAVKKSGFKIEEV